MLFKVYTIQDKVAGEFAAPFIAKNDKIACRQFLQALKSAEFPKDYGLVEIGGFDSETGLVSGTMLVRNIEVLDMTGGDDESGI